MPGLAASFRDDPGQPGSALRSRADQLTSRQKLLLRGELRKTLAPAVATVVELSPQLAPAFRSGKYSGVLWDDTAGRLPGFIYHELGALVAYDHGKPIPFGAGISAGKRELGNSISPSSAEQVEHDLAAVSQNLGPSVLLVTEKMFDGNALRTLTSALRARQKAYDVLIAGWGYYEHEMRKGFPEIVGPDNVYYRPSSSMHESLWEGPQLIAARGIDVNLSGPKALRDAVLDVPYVDGYPAYYHHRYPDLSRLQHAFIAAEARSQASVIARTLHRTVFRENENRLPKVADAVAKALDTRVRRGERTAKRANRDRR